MIAGSAALLGQGIDAAVSLAVLTAAQTEEHEPNSPLGPSRRCSS